MIFFPPPPELWRFITWKHFVFSLLLTIVLIVVFFAVMCWKLSP